MQDHHLNEALPLLEARGVVCRFGGFEAVRGVDLAVFPGQVHALIGPNGAGKTTLLSALSGERAAGGGRIYFAGEEIGRRGLAWRARRGLVRSFQLTQVIGPLTLEENVALAVAARERRPWYRAAANPAERAVARQMLERVELGHRAGLPAAEVSHGERRQLELALALALEPRCLLLDEPMAGTGAEETRRLIDLLKRLKGRFGVLLVEHDMTAVFELADHISVMALGKRVASGAPDAVRADREVQRLYLGDA